MIDLTDTELRQVRQYTAPNIRMEIDMHLRTHIPMNKALAQRLSELLRAHKEASHGQDRTRA